MCFVLPRIQSTCLTDLRDRAYRGITLASSVSNVIARSELALKALRHQASMDTNVSESHDTKSMSMYACRHNRLQW